MDSGGARPDPAPAASRLASWLRAAAWIGGGLSVVVGTVVLAGWVLGVRALESIAPGSTTMKPLTAEAFIAAGAALWVIQARDMRRGFRLVGLGLSLAVLVLGLVTLCEYAFGWNAGIDQALFRGAPGMASGGPPGRMAVGTALGLFLIGSSLYLRARADVRAADGLAVTTALIAVIALVGYAHGERSLDSIGWYGSMPLHTTLPLLVLSVTSLVADPAQRLATIVPADTDGATMASPLLPPLRGSGVLVPSRARRSD